MFGCLEQKSENVTIFHMKMIPLMIKQNNVNMIMIVVSTDVQVRKRVFGCLRPGSIPTDLIPASFHLVMCIIYYNIIYRSRDLHKCRSVLVIRRLILAHNVRIWQLIHVIDGFQQNLNYGLYRHILFPN